MPVGLSGGTNATPAPTASAHGSSYGQILKSSSIIGGAQGINYVIGLVRTKVVAVLLGPSGVGLVGLYMSIISLVQSIAQMGIDQSGVREVADAAGSGNSERIASTVKTLRRVCWATGVTGWLLTIALARPLAQWTFGSSEHVWAVAILGCVILLEAVAGGQRALLQGVRRIGDLARLQVASAGLTTIMAIGIYAGLRERGIVPVIILTSVIQLACSWWFAQRVKVASINQPWAETWRNSRHLFKLGAALMYGMLLVSVVGLAIRALVVRNLDLNAAGIYQAAWALSGIFAGFVLQAMGTDFYPRLTGVAQDNVAVNRLVNEQIEVGMVLALPGIVGGIAFAPWLMHLLYSAKFVAAADILPWFVIGVFGQVVCWPIGIIQTAKAATGWLYFGRTFGAIVQFLSAWVLLRLWGLLGVAVGFAVYVCIIGLVDALIARRLSTFLPSSSAVRLLISCLSIMAGVVLSTLLIAEPWDLLPATIGFGAAILLSVRHMRGRLPNDNRVACALEKIAGFCPVLFR